MSDQPATPGIAARRVLLLTADPDLLDDLLRLAAAAGCEAVVVDDPALAHRPWAGAPLVVVGGDLAEPAAAARLPRREDVVLVGRDLDDAEVWRRAVQVGAEHVVFLPDAEPWLVDLFGAVADGASEAGAVVAVVGGRGGAGATTLAAALAVTAARRGHPTSLIDGDPLGGGIDLILGGERAGGLRWPDLVGSRGRVSASAVTEALPRVEGLTVLSWDRGDPTEIPAAAMDALLSACARGADLTVVDLPRRLDEAARAALEHTDLVLLVVPAEVRAAAAAARVAAGLALHHDDVRVVVRGPAPARLPAETVAVSLGLPLAGSLRAEPGLAASLERGDAPARSGRGPLASFSGRLLDDLLVPTSRLPGATAA